MSEQRLGNGGDGGGSGGDSRDVPRRRGFLTRRQVLAGAGGIAAVAAFGAAGCSGGERAGSQEGTSQQAESEGTEGSVSQSIPDPGGMDDRRERAYQIRVDAASYQRNLPNAEHPNNGDDERYQNRFGSFSKSLPHDENGEVDPAAYDALLDALANGGPFDSIPQGGVLQLDSPEASFAFVMEGPDSHNTTMPPAPTFDSAET